jgi:16S rRNA (uracil1498-N3)-methyltransferase
MLKYDLFFLNEDDTVNIDKIIFKQKDEIHHLTTVLRKGLGDKICLSDKVDFVYTAEIEHYFKNEIIFKILEENFIVKETIHFALFSALLKGSHFDLQLEKAVELGVTEFHPIITHHTIADKNKLEKWQENVKTASKQCRQAANVSIDEPKHLQQIKRQANEIWIVAELDIMVEDWSFIKNKQAEKFCLFIGPEGGFSKDEILFFRDQGAIFVSLGNLRLRAETAAWAMINLFKLTKNLI